MRYTWLKAEILRKKKWVDEEKLTAVVGNHREIDGRRKKVREKRRGPEG